MPREGLPTDGGAGRFKTTNFIRGGLVMGLVGPAIAVLWCLWLCFGELTGVMAPNSHRC
ncbi:MAG: hypothetical protein KAU50_00450 [Candidatus Marinimicrobia bacterium]|nr:hypothetical protein [Candidatus Neomarinimicrobiota bacterium]